MRIVIHPTPRAAAQALAHFIAGALRAQPDLVMALPTGHTPLLLYRELVALFRRHQIDFARATTFMLDEFAGLSGADARSFHAFMQRHLFQHVNLAPSRTHRLDGMASNWRREAARYESAIAACGGLDLVVLGIGRNGHIGFNEPAASLQARTHLETLRPDTRRSVAGLAAGRSGRAPRQALSMGVGTLLNGRAVVLLATGAAKARVVRRAVIGPVTPRVPASLLQLHPNVVVVLDRAAARELE